jgi:hypothetical protein
MSAADCERINFILKSELVSSRHIFFQLVAPLLALMRHLRRRGAGETLATIATDLMAKKLPEVIHQFSPLSE